MVNTQISPLPDERKAWAQWIPGQIRLSSFLFFKLPLGKTDSGFTCVETWTYRGKELESTEGTHPRSRQLLVPAWALTTYTMPNVCLP